MNKFKEAHEFLSLCSNCSTGTMPNHSPSDSSLSVAGSILSALADRRGSLNKGNINVWLFLTLFNLRLHCKMFFITEVFVWFFPEHLFPYLLLVLSFRQVLAYSYPNQSNELMGIMLMQCLLVPVPMSIIATLTTPIIQYIWIREERRNKC